MDHHVPNLNQSWDHRRLGKQLGLFAFDKKAPGFPFLLPDGLMIKNQLIDLWRKYHRAQHYLEIQSPLMLDHALWRSSGHWDLYRKNMYFSQVENRMYAIKPMNCPGAILHFQSQKRHDHELPMRICELGQVQRHENSGSLHGLMRVRSFMVDDGHIFCGQDHLKDEVKNVIALCVKMLSHCGMKDVVFELSVRDPSKPEKYLGDDQGWEFAQSVLSEALQESGHAFNIMEGEAKFYGPAIDFKIKDSMDRYWQCSSVQLDFNLPQRFGVYYLDQQGNRHIPFLIHRAVFGSLERFMGILIEHYKGKFPFWLAPVQVALISLAPQAHAPIEKLADELKHAGVRCILDLSDRNISEKIKRVQKKYIPYIILVGQKELAQGKISIRDRSGKCFYLNDVGELLAMFEHERAVS